MKKILIWGTGVEFANNVHMVQYYELIGQIEVVGITSDQRYYNSILTYQFVPKEKIGLVEFDFLLIATSDAVLESVQFEAKEMGIDETIMVPISVMKLPKFDFDKYKQLKVNTPTIFAPNCWAGLTYHSLALSFKSPFINMFEDHDDYIKFLKKPRYYIDQPLEFVEMRRNNTLKRDYPVAKCDDILLFFNHYVSFDEAVTCWNRRKKRIDWDNLLIMFFDENIDRVKDFLSLPYENKICFVPFPMQGKGIVSIEYKKECADLPFFNIVNKGASGGALYYDVFELLLNHDVVPIANV